MTQEDIDTWDRELAEAAKHGTAALRLAWETLPHEAQCALQAAKDRRHKPTAVAADKGLVS